MKFGYRCPSFKKSFKARTTGRAKRITKRAVNPLYGKKGMGWINNPKKAAYNKVYNRTTTSMFDSGSTGRSGNIDEEMNEITYLIYSIKEFIQTVKDAPTKLSRSIDELKVLSHRIVYKKILHSKAFKIFAVLAVICNPNLLLIVVPAYGIYRLCRKNRKAPVTTESKEEDQKQVEYTEVKSIDDIQL